MDQVGLDTLHDLEKRSTPSSGIFVDTTGGIVPRFYAKDRSRLIAEMDLAEDHANRADDRGDFHMRLIKDENYYSLMENRSKESKWCKDRPLAEARLCRALDIDPWEAKILIEVAEHIAEDGDYRGAIQLYYRAARVGPPGREILWFMAGQCHEQLGEPEQAIICYINLDAARERAEIGRQVGPLQLRSGRHPGMAQAPGVVDVEMGVYQREIGQGRHLSIGLQQRLRLCRSLPDQPPIH